MVAGDRSGVYALLNLDRGLCAAVLDMDASGATLLHGAAQLD